MHPILLTGAALVGLPILLHLIMRQEPKRLPFPAFRFLKQRRRINQRKIRLRHWLLLAMRMLLIALVCLALFQPQVVSDGFQLRRERPVAAVLVIDTTPSMGYVLADRAGLTDARKRGLQLLGEPAEGPWTALDEARGRALELLEEFPPGSKVCVVESADRGEPAWSNSLGEAKQRVRDIKRTRGNGQPVTQTLRAVYALFAKADDLREPGEEPYPRLLCVLSDRTLPSWNVEHLPDLERLRDGVPKPDIFSIYIDVGTEKPVNVGLTGVEMKPQIVAADRPVGFTINVANGGPRQADNVVLVRLDNEIEVRKLPVSVSPGVPSAVRYEREGLKPGLHQVELRLATADALPFDDIRHFTFRVRQPRKVLCITEPTPDAASALAGPAAGFARARLPAYYWRKALNSHGWYTCEAVTLDAALRRTPADLGQYEVVTLMGLRAPPADLWDRLDGYVKAGGGLIVVPGGKETATAAYEGRDADELLPGKLDRWIALDPKKEGVTWTWEGLDRGRPLPARFLQLREDANIDFVARRPQAWGYWAATPKARDRVVVTYNDDPVADRRHAAILEQPVGRRGKVMLFTTTLDARTDAKGNLTDNDFFRPLDGSFYVVLANEAVRSLTGDTDDVTYNSLTGQRVLLRWPTDAPAKAKTYHLAGPDVSLDESTVTRTEGEAGFTLGPERTGTPGNFTLTSEDKTWQDGFSLATSGDESNLERVPVEDVEKLLGKDAVAPAAKDLKLTQVLGGKFARNVELFPFLMILLLLFLALENLLANRFYRQKT